MKNIILLLVCTQFHFISFAQHSIIGTWKPVKVDIPSLGMLTTNEDSLRKYLYYHMEDIIPMQYKDSVAIEMVILNVMEKFGNFTIQFKPDKTYKTVKAKKEVIGTYIYNPLTKILITKPKQKTSKTVNITFVNSVMIMENKEEKSSVYFAPVKI